MHLKRLIVAVVLLPLLYFYIVRLPSGYFFLLLLSISSAAMWEFYAMYNVGGMLKFVSVFFGVSILCGSYLSDDLLGGAVAVAAMAVMATRLFVRRDPAASLSDIAAPVVGILYIPVLMSFQMLLRRSGPEWIIFLYASVWASDSLAYYIGKGIGRRRLYREVSPNKTVAGAWGSVLGGVLGALLLRSLIVPGLAVSQALFIGIMVGVVSIIGDLVESMFKRDAGIKDSGGIIPGHGGILDKVDGSLFVGPVLYWVLIAMGITGR